MRNNRGERITLSDPSFNLKNGEATPFIITEKTKRAKTIHYPSSKTMTKTKMNKYGSNENLTHLIMILILCKKVSLYIEEFLQCIIILLFIYIIFIKTIF